VIEATVVLSLNICYYTSEQISQVASFIASQKADIIFLQEPGGCIPLLAFHLKSNFPLLYNNVTFDLTTHTILRKGTFLLQTEPWPHNFYASILLPGQKEPITLINIHLWDKEWLTKDYHVEYMYRLRYLERMMHHVKLHKRVIVAGDFNSISVTPTMNSFGYKDSWTNTYSHITTSWPVSKILLQKTHPWIVETQLNNNSNVNNGQRIDYIFTRGFDFDFDFNEKNQSCHSRSTIIVSSANWFSDHRAIMMQLYTTAKLDVVVSTAKPKTVITLKVKQPFPSSSSFKETNLIFDLFIEQNVQSPTIFLTTSGLSGEKNHYIEIRQCDNDNDNNEQSIMWFYVDGLQETNKCNLNTSASFYQYGTFRTLSKSESKSKLIAILFDESQNELMRTFIRIDKNQQSFYM